MRDPDAEVPKNQIASAAGREIRFCTLTPPKVPKAPKATSTISLGSSGAGRSEIQRLEAAADTPPDAEEESSAIVEYAGGAPRAWPEALASLDPNKPPQHVPPHRWRRFIDDCGRFLDSGWADRAAAFGWEPLDLFGCNPKRHHIFPLGLLWEVNGGRLIALHRDGAIIEIKGGGRQSYRRQPVEVGRVVLAWDLM
jgi:hypothetical protein